MNNYSKELFVDRLIQINRERVLLLQNTNKEREIFYMCSSPTFKPYLRLHGDYTVNIIVKTYGQSKMYVQVCLLLLFEKVYSAFFRVKPAHSRRFT